MRRSVDHLVGYAVLATDGKLGSVAEFYFDDATWTIRYLVVDTGGWHSARKVLIAPVVLGRPDARSRSFPVSLTREQVRNSPDIDTDKPVSRQHETELHLHYAWPAYWLEGPCPPGVYPAIPFPQLGPAPLPGADPATPAAQRDSSRAAAKGDPHLRSTWHVTGYGLHASDGDIGYVSDFIVDDETWAIVCLVVDTGKWLPGRRVLMPPAWITEVSWQEAMITVSVTQESVRHGPTYDPSRPVSPADEARLYDYYGQPRNPL